MEEVETRKLKETSSGYNNKQAATVGNGGEGVLPTGDAWDTVQSTMQLSRQRTEETKGGGMPLALPDFPACLLSRESPQAENPRGLQ